MSALFIFILLIGSMANAQGVADQIRSVAHERLLALVEFDSIKANLLHSDDFQLINPLGGTLSKDEYLGAIASGEIDYLLWEPRMIEVKLYVDAAVIRYQAEIKIKVKSIPNAPEGKFWHTDLYEKQDGQWKVVWSQATQIK